MKKWINPFQNVLPFNSEFGDTMQVIPSHPISVSLFLSVDLFCFKSQIWKYVIDSRVSSSPLLLHVPPTRTCLTTKTSPLVDRPTDRPTGPSSILLSFCRLFQQIIIILKQLYRWSLAVGFVLSRLPCFCILAGFRFEYSHRTGPSLFVSIRSQMQIMTTKSK